MKQRAKYDKYYLIISWLDPHVSLVPEKNPDTPTVSRSSEDNALSVSWNRIECESGSPYIKAYRVIYCVRDQADDNCTRKYKHNIYGP